MNLTTINPREGRSSRIDRQSYANVQSLHSGILNKIIIMTTITTTLKLIKECHESVFHLIDEGPSVMLLKQLQEKLINIENRPLS